MEHFKEIYSKLFQNWLFEVLWKGVGLLLLRDFPVKWEVILDGCLNMVLQTTPSYKARVMAYIKDKNCMFQTY